MAGEGRWLSAARLQEQIGGEHPYTYAYNNPVRYVDPSGLKPPVADQVDFGITLTVIPPWSFSRLSLIPHGSGKLEEKL